LRSIFFGLEIARRALDAYRQALEVTGHNIANAGRKEYSRQEVRLQATPPVEILSPLGNGETQFMGTGVAVASVERLRSAFIDAQMRHESSRLAAWEAAGDVLAQVEVIINEPSEAGLRSVLDGFWSAWQDLANNPESIAVREALRQQADTLCTAFAHYHQQLWALRRDVDANLRALVSEINLHAQQIAALNARITSGEAAGGTANDLRDERDFLLDRLARLVDVQVREGEDGAVRVYVGGVSLVDGEEWSTLEVAHSEDDPQVQLRWVDIGQPVMLPEGQIRALVEMRDEFLPEMLSDLDQLASALCNRVNELHREGYGADGLSGRDFFVPGGTAANLQLSGEVRADPMHIAASLTGEIGDGANALRIAGVRMEDLVGGTVDDFFRSLVARTGIRAQEARRMQDNQKLLVRQLESRRQSISGVSLDEEVANLIRYEHSYAAAARLMTVLDEMLDILINRLGMTGR